jgi:transcriptional regulator with XRE-family HTH domain
MNRLRFERRSRNISQADLAAKTSGVVKQPRLSILERGGKPRLDEILALAYALGVHASEIFPEIVNET